MPQVLSGISRVAGAAPTSGVRACLQVAQGNTPGAQDLVRMGCLPHHRPSPRNSSAERHPDLGFHAIRAPSLEAGLSATEPRPPE